MASFAPSGTRIEGKTISLRILEESDASEEYCGWLSDPEVTRYLDTVNATVDGLKKYIREKNSSESSVFFGIFARENGKHIGNIKLEPIELGTKSATLGILVGDKGYWGRGIGTEAIRLLSDWAFKNLPIDEIYGGVLPENQASVRAFLKAGFESEGLKEKPGPGGKMRQVFWMRAQRKSQATATI